jgi:hypothetical protein
MQMKSMAIDHVRKGLDSLHGMQFAHCDLCLANVFYEEATDGRPERVFLADLEYMTPLNEPIPDKNLRLSPTIPGVPSIPLELDEVNFRSFESEIMFS